MVAIWWRYGGKNVYDRKWAGHNQLSIVAIAPE
jgi:hypothetical protein